MVCKPSHIRLNSLESIWYCNLAVIITIFLAVDGNRRYNHYNSLAWPEGERPTPELRLYICLIIWAVILIAVFIPTQYLQVGNHANDQSKLGTLQKKHNEIVRDESNENPETFATRLRYIWQTLQSGRKHLGPIGATIHITSAFCLLLPVLFLQARAIQYGLLPPEMIWKSEVAEVFILENPAASNVLQIHADAPPTLVGSYQLNQTGPVPTTQTGVVPPVDESFSTFMVTINYLNYIVPLFLYAIRYADVFWMCHKGFALLISVQLMMNAVQYALGFVGMSLLYKLHWYGWEKYDIGRKPVFAEAPSLIAAFLINNITVFIAAAILYIYGYGRLKRIQRKKTTDNLQSKTLIALKCKGFLPNIAAIGALVVFICCKTPFIIEYVAIYKFCHDGRMLCCIIFDIFYIFAWFGLWVLLSVKRQWDFVYVDTEELPRTEHQTLAAKPSEVAKSLNADERDDAESDMKLKSMPGHDVSASFMAKITLGNGPLRRKAGQKEEDIASEAVTPFAEAIEKQDGCSQSSSVINMESYDSSSLPVDNSVEAKSHDIVNLTGNPFITVEGDVIHPVGFEGEPLMIS